MEVPENVQISLQLPPAALSASGIRIEDYCLPLSRSTSSPVFHARVLVQISHFFRLRVFFNYYFPVF